MKREFNGVNSCKFVDELIKENIKIIQATEKDGVTYIDFTDNTDMLKVDEMFKNHNPIINKQITDTERIIQLENAVLELAELIGGN